MRSKALALRMTGALRGPNWDPTPASVAEVAELAAPRWKGGGPPVAPQPDPPRWTPHGDPGVAERPRDGGPAEHAAPRFGGQAGGAELRGELASRSA